MPDDLTVVSSQPLPDLSVVSSQPLPTSSGFLSGLGSSLKSMLPDTSSIGNFVKSELSAAKTFIPALAPEAMSEAATEGNRLATRPMTPDKGIAYRAANAISPLVPGLHPESMEARAELGDTAGIAGEATGAALPVAVGEAVKMAGPTKLAIQAKSDIGSILRNPETNQPRLPLKVASHLAKYAGGPEVLNDVIPDNPAYRSSQDVIDAQAADEAKAADIDKARKMQDIFLRRQARETAAATKAQIQTQKSSIITPKTVVPESEGRPATWTNEKVLSMASTGDVRAIQQARLRALDLPPNAALVSNRAATITPSVGTPRSTTLFDASGHPIGGEPEIELMDSGNTSTNASGESGASMEAINRSHSERLAGTKRIRIDTRSGNETPLLGADAVDAKPGPYDEIITRDKNGNETTLDRGDKARPRRMVQ